MTKIVYNTCYGGFGLSRAGCERYAEIVGLTLVEVHNDRGISKLSGCPLYSNFHQRDIPRTDPALVQVVEELGDKANGRFAKLAIRELAPGTKYIIDEYDGFETVMIIDEHEWLIA